MKDLKRGTLRMTTYIQRIKNIIKRNKKLYKLISCILRFIRDNHFLCKVKLTLKYMGGSHEKMETYHIDSVKTFCHNNNYQINVVEEKKHRKVYDPPYFGTSDNKKICLIESPEIYITEMFNVEIVGENSFILKDKNCLYDMNEMNNSYRFDLRFSSLKSINNKRREAIIVSEKAEIDIREGIFLVGNAASNYYHLTMEILSKLKYIDSEIKYANVPLLVDEIVCKVPQFHQLLLCLNKHNREIIQIEKGKRYKIEKLVYPSETSWLPINVKDSVILQNEDFRVAKAGMKYIREMVFAQKGIEPCSEGNLKLFISRRNQYMQRLVNEKEISELFQQFGFMIIYPEEMSFDEQVDFFSKAKYVAGTSGAALTNILYCPIKAVLICIIPKEYGFNLYSSIGNHIGVESLFLDAKVVEKGQKISADKFEIDMNYCQEFLSTLKG